MPQNNKYKLAIITSHPIQYQTPLFKILSTDQSIDLKVYFMWTLGTKEQVMDPEFNRVFKWDLPLLDGYNYELIKNYSPRPRNTLFGQINLGIVGKLYRDRPELLLVHGWNSIGNILGVLAAYAFGISVAIHGDNCFSCEASKPIWKRKIKKIVLGAFLKKITAALYMGVEDRKFYEYHGVGSEKLFFMPYSTDNDRLVAASAKLDKDEIKKSLGLEGKVVLIFFGKLVERKKPEDLLSGYAHLIDQHPELKEKVGLVFVGDGILYEEMKGRVKELGSDLVQLAGFKNLSELPTYFKLGDIFVIPSVNECWGIVVNEAMCFGLPIIASDTVGCGPDLVQHGYNGFIYKTGDVVELSERIYELVVNESKREEFGKKSLEIIKRYNFRSDAEAIIKVLNLLNVNKKPPFQGG